MAKDKTVEAMQAMVDADAEVEKEIERRKLELVKEILTDSSGKEDPLVAMVKYNFLDRFLRKDEKMEGEDKLLERVIKWRIMQEALRPPEPPTPKRDTTELLLLANALGKKDDEFTKLILAQHQQQQQMYQQMYQQYTQMMNTLMASLMGKHKDELEELKKKTEDMIERLNQRIDTLMTSQPSQSVESELKRLVELRNTLKEAVEHLGIVEKTPEITDKSGKLQLGKILERGLRMAEKLIERAPLQQPQPQPVQMMPVEQPQPIVEQPEEKPKVEIPKPKIEELEKKIEKIEKETEKLPDIEITIPETKPEVKPEAPKEEEIAKEIVEAEVKPIKEEESKLEHVQEAEQPKEPTPETSQESKSG